MRKTFIGRGGFKLSDSGGRKVIDKMYDLENNGDAEFSGTDRPEWYDGMVCVEAERTNLFLNSDSLSTQSVTVSAEAYTVSMEGTGTITFSGDHTGTLEGVDGERVSTTFTPGAGSVTCTVSGTVTNAQFEAGAYPTLYIPTNGSTVTRLAPFPKIDRVDIADVFIALIDDFVFGDQDLQRYSILQTIGWEFGLFTRNNNRLQLYATTAGAGPILLSAPFPWQPVNTRKKWFFSIYVKGTEVQIGMGDPETGDLGTVEAVTGGLNTGSHDLYLSGPSVGPEGYSSHYYTTYKNLTGHPKMSVEELKDLMQSMNT